MGTHHIIDMLIKENSFTLSQMSAQLLKTVVLFPITTPKLFFSK